MLCSRAILLKRLDRAILRIDEICIFLGFRMDSQDPRYCRILLTLGILDISNVSMLRVGLEGIAGEIPHVVQLRNPTRTAGSCYPKD